MTSSPFNKRIIATAAIAATLSAIAFSIAAGPMPAWESKFVQQQKRWNRFNTKPIKQGNTIPDFSAVGYYHGNKPIPEIPVVITITPSDNALEQIQAAIDKLVRAKSPMPADFVAPSC